MLNKGFLGKTTSVAFLRKIGSSAGGFLSKAADIGGRVLNEIGKIDPALTKSGIYNTARMVVDTGKVVGNSLQNASDAKSIEDVGKSLGDVYQAIKN